MWNAEAYPFWVNSTTRPHRMGRCAAFCGSVSWEFMAAHRVSDEAGRRQILTRCLHGE